MGSIINIDCSSTKCYNDQIATPRGFLLTNDFESDLIPLEYLIPNLKVKQLIFGCGSGDETHIPSTLEYLHALCQLGDSIESQVRIIHGAGRIVSENDSSEVQDAFFEMIF